MRVTSELLAEYALEVSIDDLPDDVIEQAERLTLDTLACAVGAYAAPPSKVLRQTYGDRDGSEEPATILGSGSQVDVEYAALINGTMGRYYDFNCCYSTGESACHPSDHIPSLVSVAEAENASGADLLEAIVIAYEIQSRGVDTGTAWPNGFDYTTWGAYSAAASVGALMDLDHEALVNAIGIAGTAENGLLISRLGEVSMWKAVAMPNTVHNAIKACQMARNGLTGPAAVLDGDEGSFADAIAGEPVEFAALGGRDGAGYRIMETSIKAFACGYFTHPAVTAVLDVVQEHDLEPDEIESIEVRSFEHTVQVYASGPEKWSTDLTRETADHSLPYNVATAVLHGEVKPEHYEPDALNDERVHALMQLVSVKADEELERYRQEHPRHVPAVAQISARGETYESRANYPLGHPERPLSTAEIEDKARDLMATYLTDTQIQEIIERCEGLAHEGSVDEIVSALQI